MTFSRSITYNDPLDFVIGSGADVGSFASAKIGGVPSLTFSQNFDTSSGLVIDSTYAEISGGILQQKDLTPTSSVIGANFTASGDLNWAKLGGTTTAVIVGTPTISGGKLLCRGNTNSALRFSNSEIGACASSGGIYMRYTPQYSGTPSSNSNIFDIYGGTNANKKAMYHSTVDGKLKITIFNDSGTAIHNVLSIGNVFAPSTSAEYRILMRWRAATGSIGIYVNEVFLGSPSATAWTSSSSAVNMQIGAGIAISSCNGDFDDLILFSSFPSIAAYTVSSYIFKNSTVTLPTMTYSGFGSIVSLDSLVASVSGAPRLSFNAKYFDSLEWVASDGSYSQSNDYTTAASNISLLDVSGTASLLPKIHFTDANSISSIDSMSVEYTGQAYSQIDAYVKENAGGYADLLTSITQTATITGNDTITYVVNVNGTDKFYNTATSAWETSTSKTQSNDISILNSNFSSIGIELGALIKIKPYLNSFDGSSTPILYSNVLVYSFYAGPASEVNVVTIYGYIHDISGNAVEGATVKAIIDQTKKYNDDVMIVKGEVSDTTNSLGYWELELAEMENAGNGTYLFKVYGSDGVLMLEEKKTVPNTTTAAYNTLN